MSLPQINPLAAKLLGGRHHREELRDQLLARAEETDDPSYAGRLRDAAAGKRPLRTLLADPAFQASMGMDDPGAERRAEDLFTEHEPPTGTPEELLEGVRADLTERGIEIPTADEARELLPEVLELQHRAAEVIAQEETHGWGGSVDWIAEERQREAAETDVAEDDPAGGLGGGLGDGLGDGLDDPGDDITGPGGIT